MFAWDSESQQQHKELRLAIRQAKLLEQQQQQQMKSEKQHVPPPQTILADSTVVKTELGSPTVIPQHGVQPMQQFHQQYQQQIQQRYEYKQEHPVPSPTRKRGRPRQTYEEEEVIDEDEEQLNMERRDLPNGEINFTVIIHGVSPTER